MKHMLLALAAVALLVALVAAPADTAGAPQVGTPAGMAIMQQTHAKLEQLHAQARLAMLGALTPAHRATLAQVVGEMAIAQAPDAVAAAKALDASLTPAEAKNILGIAASLEQQAGQVMNAAHKQMESSMPAAEASRGPCGMHGMHGMHMGDERQTDPGAILLSMTARTLGSGEMHAMGMMGGPPGAR